MTLPADIITIPTNGFEDCISLKTINLRAVTTIKDNAFKGCASLTEVEIPSTLEDWGTSMFAGCRNLKKFTGKYASSDGRCLIKNGVLLSFAPAGKQSYMIPSEYGVNTIGAGAFDGCDELFGVTIPSTVTDINYLAFKGCTSLMDMTLPQSVTYLGEGIFMNCPNLTGFYGKFASADHKCLIDEFGRLVAFAPYSISSYTLPSTVTKIGMYTFYGNEELYEITIPGTVKEIGSRAFFGCKYIKSFTLPASVKKIGNSAFEECSRLETVTVERATPPETGARAFYGTAASKGSLFVPKGNTDAYQAAANWKDFKNVQELYFNFSQSDQNGNPIYYCLNVDNTTVSVCSRSDANINSYAGDVVIPEEIEEGGVKYPVIAILPKAFYSSPSLTSVSIPQGLGTIMKSAFSLCTGLKEITLPSSVSSIVTDAFKGCSSLKTVTVERTTPPSLGSNVFANTPADAGNATLYVPKGYKTAYTNGDAQWKKFTIKEISNVFSVNDEFGTPIYYYINDDGKSVTVTHNNPDTYNSYDNYRVSIPAKVTYNGVTYDVTAIGNNAFRASGSVTQVYIPASVTSIGERAFYDCENLWFVHINNSSARNIKVGTQAFVGFMVAYCTLYVPKGCYFDYYTSSPWNAFDIKEQDMDCDFCQVNNGTLLCYSFNDDKESVCVVRKYSYTTDYSGDIEIPEEVIRYGKAYPVTEIGDRAFDSCSFLTSISLPSTITAIWDAAFAECYYLTKITSMNPNPFEMTTGRWIFQGVPVSEAVLYVPIGSGHRYEQTDPWCYFHVVEKDFSGVENITATPAPQDNVYYDLMGRPVQDPTSGIYILNGRKVVVK